MSLKKLLGFSWSSPKNNAGPIIGERALRHSNRLSYDDLVNAESELGRTLFGPIPVGHRREFFEHRKNVWIWHESWLDELGKEQAITVRYEVHPAGVYKRVTGGSYKKLAGIELDNFRKAAAKYFELVKTKLYC